MTSHDYHGLHQDEANRVRALQRHEDKIRRVERERFARRLAALGPGSAVPDPDFDGCVWDQAPYPAPIGEVTL